MAAQQARKWLSGSLFGKSGGESGIDSPSSGHRDEHRPVAANGVQRVRPRTLGEKDPGDSPARHAERLLFACQDELDRTGLVPAAELMVLYSQLMTELSWNPISWNRVARSFRSLVGPKLHRDVFENGQRKRVLHYSVPASGAIVSPVQRRRSANSPLPQKIEQLELTCSALVEKIAVMNDLLRNAMVSQAVRS